ncbi:hypothetical protein RJI07_00135 [Mycoplasmatota bacterium WC30]
MKRKALGLLLFLLIVPLFMGCDQTATTAAATNAATTNAATTEATTVTEVATTEATTTEATTVEVALGSVTFEIITSGDNPETTEIETQYVSNSKVVEYFEGDTLFSLLLENYTMSCQGADGNPDDTCSFEGIYGHYVLAIDTLIPGESNEFISFNINDEYAMTGVDATELADGSVYSFLIGTF